jgi:hypothetical protein
VEVTDQRQIAGRHRGLDPLRAERAQVEQKLREQRAADALARAQRVDAHRVDHRARLDAPEVAVIHARHEEARHAAVDPRDERHAHCGIGERLAKRAAEIAAPVAASVPRIDARHAFQVRVLQHLDLHGVARVRRIVVRLAVEQLLASEGVARMIEEAQQLVLAPARGRADRCGAEARRFALEGAGERRAETLVLRSGADAEGLEPHLGLAAAELSFQQAAQHEAGEPVLPVDGELEVQVRLAARRGKAPLEVGAPAAAGKGGIDRHHGGEVGRHEAVRVKAILDNRGHTAA